MLNMSADAWLIALVLGLFLEYCLGEPKRWHPLVGFGYLATRLERSLNNSSGRITRGLLAWLLLIVPCLAIFSLLQHFFGMLADAVALWFALGARSLIQHIQRIIQPLVHHDIPQAQNAVSHIVSRDCQQLNATDISKAGLESTLENGADAIFASLFWFLLLGGYGVLLHRLANTLDAMWGYKTPQFLLFGRIAARVDDVLNYLPARLTSLSYCLLGQRQNALGCWKQQAPLWDSPNAGCVMASGAGALGVCLGGSASYHGVIEQRPILGCGAEPQVHDLQRGLDLVMATMMLWLAILLSLGFARWLI